MSEPLTSLVKEIDQRVAAAAPKYTTGRSLGVFVIFPDGEGLAEQLQCQAQGHSLRSVSLSIAPPPPRYEINPLADVTVIIYTPGRPGQNQVTANFALRKGELDEAKIEAIVAAFANVLPK
jgi:hypothetical protein